MSDSMWSRRDLIRAGIAGALIGPVRLAAGPSVWLQNALRDGTPSPMPTARFDRTLVLIELSGGNDGLNSVVPYADDAYRAARPRLRHEKDACIALDDAFGLSPALASLAPMWEARELGVVHGLGYDDPNRSHFRSIEIWETASSSEDVKSRGWIDELFDKTARPAHFAADAIAVGDGLGPFAGESIASIAFENPEAFIRNAKRSRGRAGAGKSKALDHFRGVRGSIAGAAAKLEDALRGAERPKGDFPRTRFGRQLEQAARLLVANVPTLVIKVKLGGFDTHTGQKATHARLMSQLGQGLAALRTSLVAANRWDSTLVMTYSEFGRRVGENASGGTDHGTAAPHFVLGGAVNGGQYGEAPSLTNLKNGDLIHTNDYRRLYETVAQSWWQIPAENRIATPSHAPFATLIRNA